MNSALRVISVLAAMALSLAAVCQAQEARSPGGAPEQVLEKLQAAAIQHEEIALLLSDQKFQAVIPALKDIFELGLPLDYEVYQVQEVQVVVQKLREKRQFSIAHGAVDLGLKYLQGDKSKSSLYVMKSQLYRDNGQIREATESTEMARRFYQSGVRSNRAQ